MIVIVKREEKRCEQLKMKALEPHERYCMLLKKRVCILLEYTDYKSSHYKGDQGTIYCENIVDCYHNHRPCRYSGISPGYPDPLIPVEEAAKLDEPQNLDDEAGRNLGFDEPLNLREDRTCRNSIS